MSKNLVKAYYLTRENNDTKIIDTNRFVAERLEKMQSVDYAHGNGGFQEVDMFGDAPVADPLDALSMDQSYSEENETIDSTFEEGIVAEKVSVSTEPVYTGPSPEEMIADAEKQISEMKAQASADLEVERQRVLEEARQEGFANGEAQAMQQFEAMKAELEQQRETLLNAYEEQIDLLEPKFVTTLTDIYEKIFEVDLQDKKSLVVSMLRNTMKRLDGCKNYMIHVSSEDYAFVKEHKDELLSDATREDVILDVVEDSMMKESECTIETANGIYDCGLGTELNELRKKLWLLAYEKEN